MGKKCTGCCGGNSCCGCCCGPRGATITFSLVGLLFSAVVIVPPVYVYSTDRDFEQLFPWLGLARSFLLRVTEDKYGREHPLVMSTLDGNASEDAKQQILDAQSRLEPTAQEKYRLAIFQLIDDIRGNAQYMSLVSFSIGCINIPIHLLLLGGALFRFPCLMLPWLAVTLLEHLVVGVPLIVFFGIISLYLAAQLELYLVAGAFIGGIVLLFIVSLSTWFTVHGCYSMLYRAQDYGYCETLGAASDPQLTQPLLNSGGSGSGHRSGGGGGGGPPALPPGHPSGGGGGGGYHLGQYPQYYPPHQSRQLPSAPPNGGMYPNLPTA